MKKHLLLTAILCSMASTALAGAGIDLSVVGCPGNPGAVGIDAGTVDCAGSANITVLGTWAPAEDIPDLIALDSVVDGQVSGNLDVNSFWNFGVGGCGFPNLSSSHVIPPTGCTSPVAYTDTWESDEGGSAITAARFGPSYERIGISCYRTSILPIVAEQKMFGFRIVIDTHTVPDQCPGCSSQFCLVWRSASPRSVKLVQPTDLVLSTGNYPGFDAALSFNNGHQFCDLSVPVQHHTWGQLKSLYR